MLRFIRSLGGGIAYTVKGCSAPVTCIDRYILGIYVRTLIVCFISFAGIFVVFHAFTNMDELYAYAEYVGGMMWAVVYFYGPYMLMLFELTNMMVALMALLFTFGLIRRSGELTALLSAGISHGRIVRPMLIAAAGVMVLAALNREFVLPQWQDQLGLKIPAPGQGAGEKPLRPVSDQSTGILINGKAIHLASSRIVEPSIAIRVSAPGFGRRLSAQSAVWRPADAEHPSGYLLKGVSQPQKIDQITSYQVPGSTQFLTAKDTPWLGPGQAFVASRVGIDFLQAGSGWMRMANTPDLIRRVSNSAAHCPTEVHVTLHDRWLRPFLDYSLIVLSLSLVVGRSQRNMFVVTGYATALVVLFFGLRTVFHTLGGNADMLHPATAAWAPLLILAPAAYARFRIVQVS